VGTSARALKYHLCPLVDCPTLADFLFHLSTWRQACGKELISINFSTDRCQPKAFPSRFTATDIAASNGVIHVIDSVVLPQAA